MAISQFNKEQLAFLESYINNAAPTGYESAGQQLWLDYLKPHIDDYTVDAYGTVDAIINPEKDFRVVIEAHADEISWYVSFISDDGFLHLVKNGGSDHQIAPSKRVNIHTKKGIRKAVFGWPAIHLRKDGKEVQPTLKSIFLDCGCNTKEEVLELGIHVGSVITYEDEFMVLNDKYFVGRALDNRMGGFMIAEVVRMIRENKAELPYSLHVVNSVQEEVGLRGAMMITDSVKPDVAIITDVCHDTTTPHIDKKIDGDISSGKGPVITYGPSVHNILREMIIETADENKIDFQREPASRSTGTDTEAFAYSNGGVPSALIALPLRYMHTTVEMTRIEDVHQTINLIYKTLLKITPDTNFRYLK